MAPSHDDYELTTSCRGGWMANTVSTTEPYHTRGRVWNSSDSYYRQRESRKRADRREKINKAVKVVMHNMKMDKDNKSRTGLIIFPVQEQSCMQPIWQNHKINSKR